MRLDAANALTYDDRDFCRKETASRMGTRNPGAQVSSTGRLPFEGPRLPAVVAAVILVAATLACNFLESTAPLAPAAIATRTPWPTFTPTAAPVPVVQAIPTDSPVIPPTPIPLPTSPVSGVASPIAVAPSPASTLVQDAAPLPGPPPATAIPNPPPGATVPSQPAPTAPTDIVPTAGLPTPTVAPEPSPTPVPTDTPVPADPTLPPPTPEPSGWSFVSVRVDTEAYEGGLLLVGDLINNTGASQELLDITGIFYDAQGGVVADETDTYGYWPFFVVPPDGRVPFELAVEATSNAASFDLTVDAEPTDQVARQDFEFSDIYELDEDYGYCIGGVLRNPGGQLQEDLIVVAALYDVEDRMIGFGEYYPYFEDLVGDQTEEFEVCVDTFDQAVSRFQLQAWGM